MKVPSKKTKEQLLAEIAVLEQERDAKQKQAVEALAERDRANGGMNAWKNQAEKCEAEISLYRRIIEKLLEM